MSDEKKQPALTPEELVLWEKAYLAAIVAPGQLADSATGQPLSLQKVATGFIRDRRVFIASNK